MGIEKYILLFLFLLFGLNLFARTDTIKYGELTLKVIDSITKKPLEFEIVSFQLNDKNIVKYTDKDGEFFLNKIPYGVHIVNIKSKCNKKVSSFKIEIAKHYNLITKKILTSHSKNCYCGIKPQKKLSTMGIERVQYGKAGYPTTINGKILDSITLKPIPYCVITIEKNYEFKKSKYTLEDGTYEFQNIPKGNYNIYLSYRNQKNLLIANIIVENPVNSVSDFYFKIDSTTKLLRMIENCHIIEKTSNIIPYTKGIINYKTEFEKIFIRNNSYLKNGYYILTKKGIVNVDYFIIKT